MKSFYTKTAARAVAITPVIQSSFVEWFKKQPVFIKNWVKTNNFQAKSGSFCLIPKENGEISTVFLGVDNYADFWAFGALPQRLKSGVFCLNLENWTELEIQRAVIAWGLGSYKFDQYKKSNATMAQLVVPHGCDYAYIENVIDAVFLVRDLINQPAEALGPVELAKIVTDIAKKYNAKVRQFIGDDLLKQKHNYPLVHAVGRASSRAPRFVEFAWSGVAAKGVKAKPKIALVGKGICFDSGGLCLKPPSGMETMKKDMAGAAHALGLAKMIMTAKLPVQLYVAIPLAENLIGGGSYKPGDILFSRQGKTVEIIDTDAEGRLLLADALTRAAEMKPDLIIDFASLTGAATVALGEEVVAMFTEDDDLANTIVDLLSNEKEYVWRLPLHRNYREMLDSKIADVANCTRTRHGGAITAALFLHEFVPSNIPWIHFDAMGSNTKTKPGRPEGGEAMGLRGLFNYIKRRYCV